MPKRKPHTGDHKILLSLLIKPFLCLFFLMVWLIGWIPWIKDEYQILFSLVLLLGLSHQSNPFLQKTSSTYKIMPILQQPENHKILHLNRSMHLEKYMYSQAIKISTNVLKRGSKTSVETDNFPEMVEVIFTAVPHITQETSVLHYYLTCFIQNYFKEQKHATIDASFTTVIAYEPTLFSIASLISHGTQLSLI